VFSTPGPGITGTDFGNHNRSRKAFGVLWKRHCNQHLLPETKSPYEPHSLRRTYVKERSLTIPDCFLWAVPRLSRWISKLSSSKSEEKEFPSLVADPYGLPSIPIDHKAEGLGVQMVGSQLHLHPEVLHPSVAGLSWSGDGRYLLLRSSFLAPESSHVSDSTVHYCCTGMLLLAR